MIVLYQFATSPFSEKVRRALNFKGLAYEIHEVDRGIVPTEAYTDVSDIGKFPAIRDDEVFVQDSTDILEYLDKSYPERLVLPTNPLDAAIAHVWEDWADESLYFYEITAKLCWEHNLDSALGAFAVSLPDIPRAQLKSMILEGAKSVTASPGIGRKARDSVVSDIVRHFKSLDQVLMHQDWLVGRRLSSADLAVLSQVNALLFAREARNCLADAIHGQAWRMRVDSDAPDNAECASG